MQVFFYADAGRIGQWIVIFPFAGVRGLREAMDQRAAAAEGR